MKKFIPVFMGALFTLTGAFAEDNATMDAANQAIINACRTEKGTYISFKDDKCEYNGCAYINSNGGVNFNGDNERIQGGCPIGEYRDKAKAQYKAELDKKIKELEDAKKEADRIGARGTSGSGSSAGADGGATAGATSGSGAGAAGAAGGVANGGKGSGSDDAYSCEELEGEGRIEPGGLCYNECKPKRDWKHLWLTKKEGFERKSCVECLLKYPGVYHVKKEYLPTDGNGKIIGDKSIGLGKGVTVKTGVIVCHDANGNVTSVKGTSCAAGSSPAGGSGSIIVGGSSAGSHGIGGGVGGTIIVGGSAGAGDNRPDFCNSPKKKDIEACSAWIANNQRFLCSSGGNVAACTGGASADIYARYGSYDCPNCGPGARQQSTLSGIAEIAGAIAPPLAQLGSAYFGARAYQKGQEAWAGAAKAGFEQCQLSQNNYLQYLQANELPGLTPAQQAAMNCNGYSLGGYAGLGGAMGGFYGAGYTPGFIGGMMGPYGGYNPYGMGMGGMVGGVMGGVGMPGGYVSGMSGGYISGGYVGGMVNGISLAGGYNAGMYPGGMGMPGGYVAGGYIGGGYPGMSGGYVGGGYIGGGYPGMSGGYAGGFVNGISLAGGYNGGLGMPGGYAAGGYMGGYAAGGYMGGYAAGGYMGGYAAGGYMGGYAAGGYMGGYAAGGYMGGYAAGGMAAGGYNPQATNYDLMMQQQGIAAQMGGLSGGSAMYNPMNMGYSLTANVGMGMGGGFW